LETRQKFATFTIPFIYLEITSQRNNFFEGAIIDTFLVPVTRAHVDEVLTFKFVNADVTRTSPHLKRAQIFFGGAPKQFAPIRSTLCIRKAQKCKYKIPHYMVRNGGHNPDSL
jgi:hypothetical protein